MIAGRFGENGELLFEIELISITSESFYIEALLDTGFTTGWLAINSQDLDVLEWTLLKANIYMKTAKGDDLFDLYQGQIIIDNQLFTIPVHISDNIPDFLLGAKWLEIMEVVINKKCNILTMTRFE